MSIQTMFNSSQLQVGLQTTTVELCLTKKDLSENMAARKYEISKKLILILPLKKVPEAFRKKICLKP